MALNFRQPFMPIQPASVSAQSSLLNQNVRNDVPIAASKVVKIGYFPWSSANVTLFLNLIYKANGHKKTQGETKVEKFDKIAVTFNKSHQYGEIKASALLKKYENLKSDVESRFAIDKEGANLSGLVTNKEDMDPGDSLMLTMIKEVGLIAFNKEEESKKKNEMRSKMLTHEGNSTFHGKKVTDAAIPVDSDSDEEEYNGAYFLHITIDYSFKKSNFISSYHMALFKKLNFL